MTAKQHIYNILRGLKCRGARKREIAGAAKFIEVHFKLAEEISCCYCEKKVTGITFSLDHRLPVSRGGPHSMLNLAICCKRCNMAKGAMTSEEYVGLLDYVCSAQIEKYVLPRLVASGGAFRWRRRG